MSLAELQCQMQIPTSQSSPALTVGQIFVLDCQGSLPNLNLAKTEIRLDEKQKYALKLLSAEQKPDGIQLKVTSYQAGEHQLKAVQLVDDGNSVLLGNLSFSVQSVIQKEEAKPEPYGPVGPLQVGLPWWYFVMWAAIIISLLSFLFIKIKRLSERKKLLQEIDKFGTSHTPYTQFTQSVRQWIRQYEFLAHPEKMLTTKEREVFLSQLIQSYRIFLSRTFQVPALQWPERVFISEIKRKERRLYEALGEPLKKAVREQLRAQQHQDEMRAQDLIQLLELTRKNVDAVYLFMKEQQK